MALSESDNFSSYPEIRDLGHGAFEMLAPAKINLGLKVLGKRSDGFHAIDTIFQEISLCDRLEFHPSKDWSLEIRGADLKPDEDNLVTKAARLLSLETGAPCKARIVLHKEIPMGGGLGGGSSDASIALLGLSRLWELDLPSEKVHCFAKKIGSDCSFFIYGGLARGLGRGDVLQLLEGKLEGEIVLITPPFGVSTKWAYEAGSFHLTDWNENAIFDFYPEKFYESLCSVESLSNDLENIVLSRYSELRDIKHKLGELGARVSLLSGSGSTIFAVFPERSQAMHAAQQFETPFQARICRAVGRRRAAQ